MFPVEFDHRVLDSLPVPDNDDIVRIVQILRAVVVRRVIPYLKKRRGQIPLSPLEWWNTFLSNAWRTRITECAW